MKHSLDFWHPESWRPRRGLFSLQRDLDRVLDHFLGQTWSVPKEGDEVDFVPSCDYEETDTHYLLTVEVPGLLREDLKIEATERELVISGSRKSERKDEKRVNFSERYYGKFQRGFTFASPVMIDKVEADYKDGILRISLPKAESARSKQIKISEGKGASLGRGFLGREEKEEARRTAA